MKTLMLLLIIVLPLWAFPVQQQSEYTDSTANELRSFSDEQIEAFNADPAFDYDRENFSSINVLDVILDWLWNNFFKYFLAPGTATFWEILIYLFAFATIVYIIRQFMKNKLARLFYKPEGEGVSISALNENNIHETDLNKLLEQEISNGHFRNAVRVLYLISLKVLADKNHIHWKIGKTNHDYCSEIKSELLSSPFSKLTQLYEYAWYGDFKISKAKYETISGSFQQFNLSCGQAE
jgi:hypothetical protein